MMILSRILFLLAVALLPLQANAQANATVSLSPPYPGPYEQVALTASSYAFDIDVALITWKRGNETLLSGVGAKKLTLTTGAGGTTIPITYTITTANGQSVTGSTTISPQSVELLYESKESYVPPFYEGRSLPSEGALVRVSAIALITEGGTRVPSSNLSYNWYLNGEYLEGASGVGRSSVNVTLDYLTDVNEIKVLIRSPRGITTQETVSVYPHAVMPLFYAYNDALGTDFSKTFWRRIELTGDITLSLEPYYLSNKGNLNSTASYGWYLDGLPVTPQEKTLLSLRPKENASGVRTLSVIVENTKRVLQRAQSEIEIIFDTRN